MVIRNCGAQEARESLHGAAPTRGSDTKTDGCGQGYNQMGSLSQLETGFLAATPGVAHSEANSL
ncbi:MAG TPA: hypothetical protein VMI06_16010 [Terriglobia bacterium]|nr:hypothetical protein [Terriglobia bacterium]